MPTLAELSGAPQQPQGTSQIHAVLADGTAVLSGDQTVSFVPYVRTTNPVDGYVFWLNAGLLSPQQLAQNGLQTAAPVTIAGSLHYASVGVQEEDQTIVIRKVDFTAQSEVTALSTVTQGVMYVASWDTSFGPFRFTFSTQNAFYEEADEYHYVGDAVYPAFFAQFIDTLAEFDQRQIVSNSLPIWLALQTLAPYTSLVTTNVPLFPAWLASNNQVPPYGTVDIPPGTTRALQSTPFLDRQGNHWQLMTERVRFTLYGLRNDDVMDFVDFVIQGSLLTDLYGIMEMPVVRDEHRPQVEMVALAQKKTVEMTISYYQVRLRDLTRQLIAAAAPAFSVITNTIPTPPNAEVQLWV